MKKHIYPRWRFHKELEAKLVQNEAEEKSLPLGYGSWAEIHQAEMKPLPEMKSERPESVLADAELDALLEEKSEPMPAPEMPPEAKPPQKKKGKGK
jgi:hypothetical protein